MSSFTVHASHNDPPFAIEADIEVDSGAVCRRKIHGRDRRGASMVMLAMLLPVVLGIAAFVVNIVYMELVRTELQITTDVATRAAGRTLAVTGDEQEAILAAQRLLNANPYANRTLGIYDTNVTFGVSTRESELERYQFDSGKNPNAVRISAKGTDEVPMLFPTMGVPIKMRPIKSAISTQTELDVSLVLDRSGSMAYGVNEDHTKLAPPDAAPIGWQFGHPCPPQARWLDTVAAVESFLSVMEQSSHEEAISMATYNQGSMNDVQLTIDYSEIRAGMVAHTQQFNGGSTNIGAGMAEGIKELSDEKRARPWATRIMIVLSDGRHVAGTDPLLAAKAAAAQKILVYTVTFSEYADIPRMQAVAEAGAGEHFHADSAEELKEVFEEIARSLPTLITF